MADKLDALMAMTLTHMASRAAASPVQVQRLWDAALAAFQHSILLTHRAKFTPYIVFAAAVRTRDGGADFVQLLVSRICDTVRRFLHSLDLLSCFCMAHTVWIL